MKRSLKEKASSLVTTLMVIVVLTVIVVAFMQSMSIERLTSRSYFNVQRASLIAEAGMNVAGEAVMKYATNDDFIVVRRGNYDFIGKATSSTSVGLNGTVRYLPLYSSVTNVDALVAPMAAVDADVLPSATPAAPTFTLKKVGPDGGDVDVSWVNVTNSAGKVVGRFAYYIQDLSALVDADVAGNSTTLVRDTGTNASELALYTIFSPSNNLASEPESAALIAKRANLFSIPSLKQIVSTNGITNLTNVTARLVNDLERDVIPAGLGYAQEGTPKTNLNQFVSSGDVTGLANYISGNLPLFGSSKRFGGANAQVNYLSNLAANLIDYADADSDPTTDGTTYRGMDAYPLMTTHYMQFHWRRVNSTGGLNPSATPTTADSTAANFWYAKNGTWHARVDLTTYIQVWNLSNQTIASGTLQLFDVVNPASSTDYYNRYSIYAIGEEIPCATSPMLAGQNPAKTYNFATTPLAPNEFRVIQFPAATYECDTGVSTSQPRPNLSSGSPMRIGERDGGSTSNYYDGNYQLTWNNRFIDRPGGTASSRIGRNSGVLDRETAGDGPDWRGIMPGLRYDAGFPVAYEQYFTLGDPRGNYMIQNTLAANDYDANSSWWGRHFAQQTMIPNGSWFGQETRVSTWPDGGINTEKAGSIYNLNPGSGTVATRDRNQRTPFDPAVPRAPLQTNAAPTRISNAGTYTNILELGNVYDPIRWRPVWSSTRSGDANVPADQAAMTNSWQNLHKINLSPSSAYVVPGTLRIGRAEYQTLNTNGVRSAQLLDIFAVTNNPRISTKGRINLNTATRDALRVLVTGIRSTNDPNALTRSGSAILEIPNALSSAQGALFADTVISNRPFLSTSKLSWMTNSNGGFFGNPDQYANTNQIPVYWNDAAHEEFFKKLFSFVTVRSRNFKVCVVADSLNDRGKTLARVRKTFQIFVKPARTADGTISSQSITILSEINE